MTITETSARSTYVAVTVDLYRDIHKGIRTRLFAVTEHAARVDPGSRLATNALVDDVGALRNLLEHHAEHEDAHILPVLQAVRPDLAEQIASQHVAIDERLASLTEVGAELIEPVSGDQRARLQHLGLDLAMFTATFLEHQDLEERVVNPVLDGAIGAEGMAVVHDAIVSSIPPDEMADSLAIMLPAMNVEDRVDLLMGMRAAAPAEAFAGVWALAGTVLPDEDLGVLEARLGL